MGRKNRASRLEKEHFVLIPVTHHCTFSSVITRHILNWKATKEEIWKKTPFCQNMLCLFYGIYTWHTQGISLLRVLEKLMAGPASWVHNRERSRCKRRQSKVTWTIFLLVGTARCQKLAETRAGTWLLHLLRICLWFQSRLLCGPDGMYGDTKYAT